MCVVLAVCAVLSFRSIPRALAFLPKCDWIPHFTSIINWVLRYGLAQLQAIQPVSNPWIAIVDMSMNQGIQKILLVLRVPLSALSNRGSALTLEDVQCLGIEVSQGWNGKKVAVILRNISLSRRYTRSDTQG